MSTMNVTTTHTELQPATPANGNGLAAIETDGQAPSAAVVARGAPTAADLEKLDDATRIELGKVWADHCQQVGQEFQNLDARRDSYLQRSIAALALSIAFFPATDWGAKVNALGIGSANIKSKHRAAMAVVATFGLNPHQSDKTQAKLDGQAIDRNALATEWLAIYVAGLDSNAKTALTLDDAGIDQLSQVLVAHGGIRVVGDIQRAANRDAAAAGRLRLAIHKQGAAPIIEERGEKRFRAQHGIAAGAPLPFTIDVKVGDAQAAFTIPDKLVTAIRSSVFESAAGVDPLVDVLGELMKASAAIPHQLIGTAAAASPEMGAGSRQVVLCADRSVQVSTMPASNVLNPVLIARPASQIIDPWPTNACRMESEGWQFAEANLIDADRRKYFEASVEVDAGSPSSISLTTATGADNLCTETFELEPLVKGMAAYPVEFDTSSCKADFEFEVDAESLTDWRDEAATKLRDTESLVKLVATGTGASLKAGKHNLTVIQTGAMTAGQIYLRGTDFVAVAKAIDGLDLANNGMVSFEIDQDLGMRVSFATSLATYELYVPVVQAGSFVPFTHGFRPMTVA